MPTLVRGEALAARAAFSEREGLLGLALEPLSDERVQRRQPVQQRRGIFGVERVTSNTRIDERAQAIGAAAKLVVLLGRLDDSGEVDPAKALELLGLLCDAVQLAQNFL